MIKRLIEFIFILSPILLNSQNSTEKLPVYDTVQVYKCTYNIIRDGDSTYYKIDGKAVSKKEIDKVLKAFREQKKCNPCVLKKFNMDGSIDSQGVFYYTCPGLDEKTEIRKESKDKAHINIHVNSCNDGEWLYYSRDGKLKEIKYFDHGQELKTKSKLIE